MIANGWNRCTVPPATKNTRPWIGQSAVARYATNGDTFAGSIGSKPVSGVVAIASVMPGVASVSLVLAAGAIAFAFTPYLPSSRWAMIVRVAIPVLAEP
jgi:hypothetical protein